MGIDQFIMAEAVYGREKGYRQAQIEIAREMKKDGISTAQIARFTKLSAEEIEKLKR